VTAAPYGLSYDADLVPDYLKQGSPRFVDQGAGSLAFAPVGAGFDFVGALQGRQRSIRGLTTRQVYDGWRTVFTRTASAPQKKALRALDNAATSYGQIERNAWDDLSHEEALKVRDKAELALSSAEDRFRDLLNPQELGEYDVRAREFVRTAPRMGLDGVNPTTFSVEAAREWVSCRAHELGWSAALFACVKPCANDRACSCCSCGERARHVTAYLDDFSLPK
jgi:hypothetical protein